MCLGNGPSSFEAASILLYQSDPKVVLGPRKKPRPSLDDALLLFESSHLSRSVVEAGTRKSDDHRRSVRRPVVLLQ